MKATQIAEKYNVTESYISHIKHHRKFISDIKLAKDIAALTGEKPIVYVTPKLRKIALTAYPDLNKVA